MIFKSFFRYSIILISTLIIAACATVPDEIVSSSTSSSTSTGSQVIDGVYVGSETIEMLAVDVPDRAMLVVTKVIAPVVAALIAFNSARV